MKSRRMELRCFAVKKDGVWQAVCIDLNLAAQDKSLHHARVKLHGQINDYVHEALYGEHKAYAKQLLSRKSPLSLRMKYHWVKLVFHTLKMKDGLHHLFEEKMPSDILVA